MVRMTNGMKISKALFTSSRGGKSYDAIASVKMLKDPCIQKFFDKYPNYQLDGEVYVHGKNLEELSGSMRKKVYDEARHGDFQFWIFDIIADGLTFEERLEILKEIVPETNSVVIVEHVLVTTVEEVMELHDAWVELGFEGGIWRCADSDYKEGKDARMIKVKLMQDDEFEIIGISAGLRDEDMAFILKTEDGHIFEAKPMGSVAKRKEYLDSINELIGKKATIKYFYISEKGVPNLPVFKTIREEGE